MRRRKRPEQSNQNVDDNPPDDTFEVREGDVLTVNFAGAKLQIAPYSIVELDGAIYQRQLKPGDDPDEEFARIYQFIRRRCLERANQKLADFAEELRGAKAKVEG